MLTIVHPVAHHQRLIKFLHLAFSEHIVQRYQRTTTFRNDQQARRIAVEPMRQFQEAIFGASRAQSRGHPKRHPTATMHRHTMPPINNEQVDVLVHHRKGRWRCRNGLFATGHSHWRDTQYVTWLHTVVVCHTPLIYAHLASTYGLINMAFGHPAALADQVIVDTLPRQLGVNLDKSDTGKLVFGI